MNLIASLLAQTTPWLPLLAQEEESSGSWGFGLILAVLPILLAVGAVTRVDQREEDIDK